jgi:hypothetical protein
MRQYSLNKVHELVIGRLLQVKVSYIEVLINNGITSSYDFSTEKVFISRHKVM